jgi:hypothetical protein
VGLLYTLGNSRKHHGLATYVVLARVQGALSFERNACNAP